jgi:class 3 adenylate cyclase
VKTTGDGVHAVFDDAVDAIAATVDLQQALADPAATGGMPLRVRCGLHAGVVERRDNDYFGSHRQIARATTSTSPRRVRRSPATLSSTAPGRRAAR